MDCNNGLLIMRVDGLEGFTFNARDELIVDKAACCLANEGL